MVDFADIASIDGTDNMGGITRKAYFIPIDDLTALPGYKSTPADLSDYIEVDGTFTYASGKNFWEIVIEHKTGMVDDKAVEGDGNNGFESTFEFFLAGNKQQHLGFARKVKNTKGVWIVQESDGNWRVLGIKEGIPAIVEEIEATTAKTNEGGKGATYRIRSYQNGPAPVFTGSIELDNSESLSM